MRILIAEDDGVTRQILTSLLQRWGYEVVIACDGNQAWEQLQRDDAPHLAILDWVMPGADGVELCRKARTMEKEIHPYLILLTAMNNKKFLVKGFDAGADDYLTKPFYPEELHARIRAGERIVNLQIESLTARNALRNLANYDFLTGLRNRGAILAELGRELERGERAGQPVNVALADVDRFKRINDTMGHQVGDMVLSELAKRMASEVRSYETVGRWGGEEFLVILSGCDLEGAAKQADRTRRAVASREFEVRGLKIPVTVSLGVASSAQLENPTMEALIEMADAAMYAAKLAGRNRVEVARRGGPAAVFPLDAGENLALAETGP